MKEKIYIAYTTILAALCVGGIYYMRGPGQGLTDLRAGTLGWILIFAGVGLALFVESFLRPKPKTTVVMRDARTGQDIPGDFLLQCEEILRAYPDNLTLELYVKVEKSVYYALCLFCVVILYAVSSLALIFSIPLSILAGCLFLWSVGTLVTDARRAPWRKKPEWVCRLSPQDITLPSSFIEEKPAQSGQIILRWSDIESWLIADRFEGGSKRENLRNNAHNWIFAYNPPAMPRDYYFGGYHHIGLAGGKDALQMRRYWTKAFDNHILVYLRAVIPEKLKVTATGLIS